MSRRLDQGNATSTQQVVAAGIALACLAAAVLAMFGPVLLEDQQFAFQDAGHYYYPLLQRVQQEWDAGRLPLWAPEASAGTPLLGNPTAAVLYPGKLIFFVLPHAWAVRVFLVGHVALAYLAMWWLLRGWRISATGATLGSLAYAFGVPVLSQTSNMIFLVGASWAPLGFLAADRWARSGSVRAVAGMAVVLALQVLGGDPEAAYVTAVCATGYAVGLQLAGGKRRVGEWLPWTLVGFAALYLVLLCLSWRSAQAVRVASEATSEEVGAGLWSWPSNNALIIVMWAVGGAGLVWRWRKHGQGGGLAVRVGGVVVAAGLGLAVSGVQLLPILEYTGMSFRAAATEGLHDVYPYSANPLQLLDAVWPGLYGQAEAGYRSWLNALPPKPGSRLWMPSLYVGGLTLVLAVAGLADREGKPWRYWLGAVLLVSLLGALGYHASPILWARWWGGWEPTLGAMEPAFSWQVRQDGRLRDGDGGVYWLLASALPGFGSFRYPPKLLVFSALAVSALAGAGWDRLATGRRCRWAGRLAVGLLGLGVATLVWSWAFAEVPTRWLERLAVGLRDTDEPLDVARAVEEARAALAHGVVVQAAVVGLLVLVPRRPRLGSAVAVGLLLVDLVVANAGHVVVVPQEAFEGVPKALEVIERAERESPAEGPYRVQRVGAWWPASWSSTGGEPRSFERVTRWERDTLRPNYGMPLGVELVLYLDTIEPLDYGLFFLPWTLEPEPGAAARLGMEGGQKAWYYPRRGLDLWNTRYFIVPGKLVWDSAARGYGAVIPNSTFLYPEIGAFEGEGGATRRTKWGAEEDFRVLRNEAAYPRGWVVHRAAVLPESRGLSVASRRRVMQSLLYQADDFWRLPGVEVRDPRTMAWVETGRPDLVSPFLSGGLPSAGEFVKQTAAEPGRVEFQARLETPGLVVVADRYYPGWTLTVNGAPGEILRTNRAMRGVALPAGTHDLVFEYRPWSVRLGAGLSVLGLVVLLVLLFMGVRGTVWEGEQGASL